MKKQNLALAISAALVLSACGGGSNKSEANAAPNNIALSKSSVDENMKGATIGTLSATDANSGDTFTFSVEGDMFVVDGNTLKLAASKSANYEAAKELKAKVTVKDKAGASYSKELTISVNDLLDTYTFKSKLNVQGSSVSYSGQTARHVLINELNHYIDKTLDKDIKESNLANKAEVLAKLNSYFNLGSNDKAEKQVKWDNFPINSIQGAKQTHLENISGSYKDLAGKIAGNDPAGQHEDWNKGAFVGWGAKGSTTPEGLIDILFGQLADNAVAGERIRADGEKIDLIYVTEDGVDLKQLIQKFLLMAIPYSQATDDYLGHETAGKGLTTDNKTNYKGDAKKTYTALEHQFDEGFGYFGAARDYLEYTDSEIAKKGGRTDWQGQHDTNNDGKIDLKSEFNFGQSVNAAKRDRSTKDNAKPTDFTKTTMEAFIAGRKIINDNVGKNLNEFSEADRTALLKHRDNAVSGWEKAIAATVVHYINDTIKDLDKLGTDNFEFNKLAKHWSEMKGFALGLQFNPYSKINDEQFAMIHEKMGMKPVLTVAEKDDYEAKLLEARDIIQAALKFDADNVKKW
ncbi:MAG: DUF4856 domain-containing protein [Parashewanella sp.]